MFAAKVLADSIAQGTRLTTLQVTFPRFVLAEFNTHREFSRNSASSRAIPVKKRVAEVSQNPFIPEAFAVNQKGMQAGEALDEGGQENARIAWLDAAQQGIKYASVLEKIKIHKQWANRLTEPFAWHTVIVTATAWENFFNLRISGLAQPEIRRPAEIMREAMAASTPVEKKVGEWHLPLIFDEDLEAFSDHDPAALPLSDLPKVSCARCARVSYLTHDGVRDLNADINLASTLLENGHMSPFEHAAKVASPNEILHHALFKYRGEMEGFVASRIGNFSVPWLQYRKTIAGEDVFRGK